MRFTETPIKGAYLIAPDFFKDERGFFARVYCADDFKDKGIAPIFVQANNSLSCKKGTLRGMHYQLPPKAEDKLVRCIKGSFYDVVLDLRHDSSTFGQWYGVLLTAENLKMMYVPKGCAHGFITLEDNSEVFYMVSETYSKEHERGIRWNDPYFKIEWPEKPTVISEKDMNHPDFNPEYHLQLDKIT